jgi:hypothetical protein
MEIGLIYSKTDPRQAEARDFVKRFIEQRGITARFIESEQPVASPTVIINGETLSDKRTRPRGGNPRMFPDIDDIARVLEQHLWSL